MGDLVPTIRSKGGRVLKQNIRHGALKEICVVQKTFFTRDEKKKKKKRRH